MAWQGLNDRYVRYLHVAYRVVTSLLVTYLFVIVLLIATAQNRIVEQLASQDVGYDYNVAVQYYVGPESLRDRSRAIAGQLASVRHRLRVVQAAQPAPQQKANQAALALAQWSVPLANVPGCLITPVAAGPPDVAQIQNLANVTLNCTIDPAARTPQLDAALVRMKAAATVFNDAASRLESTNRLAASAQEELTALEEAQRQNAERTVSAARSQGIMAVLEMFRESKWPLVQSLMFVPPPLMAIILAFSSGLFGALLITLVLSVYPHNKFQFTRSNSYSGRILLGGLIALGVVVLSFSGVAVLGNQSAADSQNAMAYAAMGLLAGMFSDQAAGWLSRTSRFSGAPAQASPPSPPTPPSPPSPRSRARRT